MAKQNSSKVKKLSIWGFIVLTLVYLLIIKGVGLIVSRHLNLEDGRLGTTRDIVFSLWIPIGASLIYVYSLIFFLGWAKPVFNEVKRVRKWVWIVPAIFITAIILGINYPGLADNGIVFTLALLIATQFVGWAEEGMFRGIGVTTLRQYNITEGKVALWSSVIFGAAHIANILGGDAKAFIQAAAVAFAGYFFYLIRRVSGSNVLNSVLHGLFDFMLITGSGIIVAGKPAAYIGSLLGVLVYIIVGIILLVRRHDIEPVSATKAPA